MRVVHKDKLMAPNKSLKDCLKIILDAKTWKQIIPLCSVEGGTAKAVPAAGCELGYLDEIQCFLPPPKGDTMIFKLYNVVTNPQAPEDNFGTPVISLSVVITLHAPFIIFMFDSRWTYKKLANGTEMRREIYNYSITGPIVGYSPFGFLPWSILDPTICEESRRLQEILEDQPPFVGNEVRKDTVEFMKTKTF